MIQSIRSFLALESAGGILLFVAAVLAMIIANSPLDFLYEALLERLNEQLGPLQESAAAVAELDVLADLDQLASTWRDDSELSALNAGRSLDWIPVSKPFCELLTHALEISEITDGAFYGYRRQLFYDLCKLLPYDVAQALDAVYKNPQASTAGKMNALLEHFQGERVLLLLDNFEPLVDASCADCDLLDAELDEALRSLGLRPRRGLGTLRRSWHRIRAPGSRARRARAPTPGAVRPAHRWRPPPPGDRSPRGDCGR